jgi:hypothetical protein
LSEDKPVEIGEQRQVVLDQLYIIHRRGDPFEEGREIARLIGEKVSLDTGEGPQEVTLTQGHFAKLLNISQAAVFRLISLTTLEPYFEEMYREGGIAKSTAYELAALTQEEREPFKGREKITYEEVNQYRRDLKLAPLLELAAQPFPEYDNALSVELQQAEAWWKTLSPSEKVGLYKTKATEN